MMFKDKYKTKCKTKGFTDHDVQAQIQDFEEVYGP